jgi:hypothetical protein
MRFPPPSCLMMTALIFPNSFSSLPSSPSLRNPSSLITFSCLGSLLPLILTRENLFNIFYFFSLPQLIKNVTVPN